MFQDESLIALGEDLIEDSKPSVIYAFDLDSTLTFVKSGNKMAQTFDDWEFYPGRLDTLKHLISDSNNIVVIVSNQKLANQQLAKDKCASIFEHTGITLYAATRDDFFRKPGVGIFERIVRVAKPQAGFVHNFIGDAAGRPASYGRSADHADSDRKYAYNVLIWSKFAKIECSSKFFTPEQFFDGVSEKLGPFKGFDPAKYVSTYKSEGIANQYQSAIDEAIKHKTIVLSGPPASGKTSLAKVFESMGYFRLSLDEASKKSNYSKFLSGYDKIVIDATHPNKQSLEKYGSLKDATYIRMNISREMAEHMNIIRSWYSGCEPILKIAYNVYYKKLEDLPHANLVIPDIFKAPKRFTQLFAMRTTTK